MEIIHDKPGTDRLSSKYICQNIEEREQVYHKESKHPYTARVHSGRMEVSGDDNMDVDGVVNDKEPSTATPAGTTLNKKERLLQLYKEHWEWQRNEQANLPASVKKMWSRYDENGFRISYCMNATCGRRHVVNGVQCYCRSCNFTDQCEPFEPDGVRPKNPRYSIPASEGHRITVERHPLFSLSDLPAGSFSIPRKGE
jgi:hypothetical protein